MERTKTKKCFISNCQMTLLDVYRLFRAFGPIEAIYPADNESPAVFVEFESLKTARQFNTKQSIAINGHRFAVDYLEEQQLSGRPTTSAVTSNSLRSHNQRHIQQQLSRQSDNELTALLQNVHWTDYCHIAHQNDRLTRITAQVIASRSIRLAHNDLMADFTNLALCEHFLRTFGPAIKFVTLHRLRANKCIVLQMIAEYCSNFTELWVVEIDRLNERLFPYEYRLPSTKPSTLIRLKVSYMRELHPSFFAFVGGLRELEFDACILEPDTWKRTLWSANSVEKLVFSACARPAAAGGGTGRIAGSTMASEAAFDPKAGSQTGLANLKHLELVNCSYAPQMFEPFFEHFDEAPIERFVMVHSQQISPSVQSAKGHRNDFNAAMISWLCHKTCINSLTLDEPTNGINDEDVLRLASTLLHLNELSIRSPYITLEGIEKMLALAMVLTKACFCIDLTYSKLSDEDAQNVSVNEDIYRNLSNLAKDRVSLMIEIGVSAKSFKVCAQGGFAGSRAHQSLLLRQNLCATFALQTNEFLYDSLCSSLAAERERESMSCMDGPSFRRECTVPGHIMRLKMFPEMSSGNQHAIAMC